jgi:[protein-PII] uridylyltransferase
MADVGALRQRIDALARAYPPGQHGRWLARERADALDAWFLEAAGDLPQRVAVVALGGYGRRLQLPASDVDVMVVHDGLDDEILAELGQRLWYPLWDDGWTVTPLVRMPAACAEAARDRLDSRTALLDARLLAGSATLLAEAVDPVIADVRGEPAALAHALETDRERRRERAGSCAHDLTPDLKEGVGGLRDVASLGWLAIAVRQPLADAGLIRAADADAVDVAEEFFVRARSAVHAETGKRTDRLSPDLQPEVAASMGFVDEPGAPAIDVLMRTVFEHARTVDAVVRGATAWIQAGGAPSVRPAIGGPAIVLETLADLAERTASIPPEVSDAIAAADLPNPVTWDDAISVAFVRLLRTGRSGADALELLDRLGVLGRFLPAWDDVRCRPQRDPYHRFTVDGHLLGAVASMAALLADPSRDPLAAEVAADVADPDALLLGALFHDVGKVGTGDHVPVGAAIARAQLDAMSLPQPTADLAAFMVAKHLLLPDTATRRDLTDENLVMDVAATVGTRDRLAALAFLAIADAAATGPAAWTPWRQTLVRELVAKVRRVLEAGTMGVQLAATLAERTERVRGLLAEEPEADVDRFVLRMPRGYFLSIEPARAARHFRTIAPFLGSNEVRTAAVGGTRPDTYELLVVTPDRPALLSMVAGALAVGGISILSAQVFTTDDHVAVDLFEVEGVFEPEITEERWRSFRTTLRRAVEGSIAIDRRVEETRRHYRAPMAQTPVTVRVDNEASDFSTVLEVGAPDRIGLLYDITSVFVELGMDVHLAKVATFGGRVVDAFYVRDEVGRKITSAERVAAVEAAMRARLG